MYERLLKLYKNKIIESPKEFNPSEYYYFYNEKNEVFGIKKDLAENEYELIKGMYIEKTFYYNNKMEEKIHQYIFDNGAYPFKNKKYQFMFYKTKAEHEYINGLLKDIFGSIEVITYHNWEIVFFQNKVELNIEELFRTISFDFGKTIYVHEGFNLNSETNGKEFLQYINAFLNTTITNEKEFSNSASFLYEVSRKEFDKVALFMKKNILKIIEENEVFMQVIEAYFINDLNISQTAAALYMNRNTLNGKLVSISKHTGLNIQSFKQASAILLLLNYKS